jgi:RNA polymerase sigma-70 factor (ECF subfamily)
MAVRAVASEVVSRPVDPDARLVAAARADRQAFVALYERYFERVLAYVRLRVRDSAACEDVTSHVFTTALDKLGSFRGEGSFAGWLFQIARNAVADAHRQPLLEHLPEEVPSGGSELEQRLIEQERADLLRQLVRSLEPEQQHLLALRYGAGLSFAEIGAIVGASEGTVRVRLHRLLHELRERYPHDA